MPSEGDGRQFLDLIVSQLLSPLLGLWQCSARLSHEPCFYLFEPDVDVCERHGHKKNGPSPKAERPNQGLGWLVVGEGAHAQNNARSTQHGITGFEAFHPLQPIQRLHPRPALHQHPLLDGINLSLSFTFILIQHLASPDFCYLSSFPVTNLLLLLHPADFGHELQPRSWLAR